MLGACNLGSISVENSVCRTFEARWRATLGTRSGGGPNRGSRKPCTSQGTRGLGNCWDVRVPRYRAVNRREFVDMTILAAGMTLTGPSGAGSLILEGRHGGGRFGHVHLAQDTITGRRAAIKFPQSSLLDSAELIAFKNDLLAAGKVKHPNVVEVVWGSPDTDPPYIVMEYADGGTLKDEIQRRRQTKAMFGPDEVRRWFDNIIDGIEAINAQLLHRDIKPDNILIHGGTLKITDFGLSKVVDAVTRSQTFKEAGALAYLAPEAWRGETNTHHRDMYATGLTLFEIATLDYALPMPAEISGWKETHFAGRAKRLSAHRPDMTDAIEQILLRMIAKRPADRFASWAELRAAFAAAWTQARRGEPAAPVSQIVRAVTEHREQKQAVASAREVEVERESELLMAANHMWNKLVDDIRDALQEAADVGAIQLKVIDGDLTVTSDGRFLASIRRVWLGQAQKLRGDTFCEMVGIATAATGRGFNAVLQRTQDDLYGKWHGYQWRPNFVFRAYADRAAPFALDGEDLSLLKVLKGMTSSVQYDSVSDMPARFSALVTESIGIQQ